MGPSVIKFSLLRVETSELATKFQQPVGLYSLTKRAGPPNVNH